MKLNALLAKTDHLAAPFKTGISEFAKFFKDKQGAFKGILKTYELADANAVDDPTMRGQTLVVTTVLEKLKWLEENSAEYIDALFSQEATNASGTVKTELKVGDLSFGQLSSLELLRLKSILKNETFVTMYATIPVREDAKTWTRSKRDEYSKRMVFEDAQISGVKRTTEKEDIILLDPNLANIDGAKYAPTKSTKTTTITLGYYTTQNFTGELTHRERAEILERRTALLTAIEVAIKTANEQEAIASTMTANKLFSFLHRGDFSEAKIM